MLQIVDIQKNERGQERIFPDIGNVLKRLSGVGVRVYRMENVFNNVVSFCPRAIQLLDRSFTTYGSKLFFNTSIYTKLSIVP